MKRINVLTYCTYTSIGSILQAYGLQRQLSNLFYEATVLIERKENKFVVSKITSVKSLCKFIFENTFSKQRKRAYDKRLAFINKNIKVKYFENYNELLLMSKEDICDIYLSGSDQVWQPDNCNLAFFLDFVKNQKCISYAASMGKTIINDDKKIEFKRLINNFDYISVREDECAEVIKEMTEKTVDVHIDPTFLIPVDEWRKISVPYNIKAPYILLYMLYWDEACKSKIKQLKKQTGLKVYAIADGLSRVYADKVLYDVGIEEFLWLVDHAEYFITSSFHGTAFAAIFNKKFVSVINPSTPSRIQNLQRKIALPIIDIEDLITSEAFDYQLTNQLIETEKIKSIEYLKRVIE